MSNIFTATPGYSGFYGPTEGNGVIVSFGRANGATTADALASQAKNLLGGGFFADSYSIRWSRPTQSKRFLNATKPVAIVGYGSGTVTFTGLLGTYAGFQEITGDAGGTSSTRNDVCNPLVCLIKASNNYESCEDEASKGIDWICYNLLFSDMQVTGRIEDNGTMFQQANIVFTLGGLAPQEASLQDPRTDGADEPYSK